MTTVYPQEQQELCVTQPVLTCSDRPVSPTSPGVVSHEKTECLINFATVSALYLPGKVAGFSVKCLVDSGCTLNLLAKRVFDKIANKISYTLQPFQHSSGALADGSGLPFYGQVNIKGRLRSEVVDFNFVVADVEPDVILGMPFLQSHNCQLRCADFTLIMNGKPVRCTDRHGVQYISNIQAMVKTSVPPQAEKMIECRLLNPICSSIGVIEGSQESVKRGIALAASVNTWATTRKVWVRCMNPASQACDIPAGTVLGRCIGMTMDQIGEELTVNSVGCRSHCQPDGDSAVPVVPAHVADLYKATSKTCTEAEQQQAIAQLLANYSDVFSCGEDDPGRTKLMEHSIPVQPGTRPIKQAPRRLGVEKEAEVSRQIQKLQEQGLIEPGHGAWSSPVVLVKKKNGSWRFCIDYRRLNAVTVQDAHPLPRIDESLEALSGSVYFSTLDLMSGYWQVPLDEDAKDKAAFCTREGLWRWKVLPFGLTAAPATFQRMMEKVLHGLHWKSLLLYLDDVIVMGSDFQSHFNNLEQVLSRLRSAGLKLKPSKCHLFQTEVAYLGHVVSQNGVATDPDKVSAVAEWPAPKNLSELQSFLGTVGYYRQYVEDFAHKARPLTKLTSKNVKYVWTTECQEAFEVLRQSLLSSPVLAYPDPNLEYILDTDASLDGVGAVLLQVQDGRERVISYYSRTLSAAQRNYCVTRRELLAVVKAVSYFRPYLYGKEFRIRTDHASLLWLCRRTTPSAQVARWLEILSEFSFIIEHRVGSKHGNADGLSRRPCLDCKKCDRITKSSGGPSMQEIVAELSTRSDQEFPLCTRVDGEQLCVPKNVEEIGICSISPSGDCGSNDQVVSSTSEGTQPAAHESCLAVESSTIETEDSLGAEQDSFSHHNETDLDNDNAQLDSKVLCESQQMPGDVSTIYKAVKDGHALDPQVISLGSSELKKLNTMVTLMKIREDGVLVTRIMTGQRTREVVICPRNLKKEVMWSTHRLSHAGFMRSQKRLMLTWYWPGITSDIRRLVNSCEVCQQAKSGGLTHPSSQGSLWVGRPWQKVAIDLVGPLPLTSRGNQWILVLTDHFTRWQDAIPLPDATAPIIAEALDSRVFCYFGLPEEIHSDRGAQFEGDLMTELCDWWRVRKTRTTAYHPQSNGVVERGNRTLGDALRTLLFGHGLPQENWDRLLPQIMRSFRATPHSSTEETANYVMFGRECRLPDQLLHGTHSIESFSRPDYVMNLQERLVSVHDLLRSQQQLPCRSSDTEDGSLFKEGDLVLVEKKHKKKGFNPKLQPKFEGPFLIKKVFTNGTYKVSGRGVVNECRLKLFTPCPDTDGQPVEAVDPEVGPDPGLPNIGLNPVPPTELDTETPTMSETPSADDSIRVDVSIQPDSPVVVPEGRNKRRIRRPPRFDDYEMY